MRNPQAPKARTELAIQFDAEMARRGVTLPQLADRLGVPYSTLHRRLDNTEAARLRDLRAIATALDASLPDLMARAEERAA